MVPAVLVSNQQLASLQSPVKDRKQSGDETEPTPSHSEEQESVSETTSVSDRKTCSDKESDSLEIPVHSPLKRSDSKEMLASFLQCVY